MDLFGHKSAVISPCGCYRYRLDRRWDSDRPRAVWIMLNPSTADADADDPTLRRVIAFSRSWGFGAATVVNLFAWRATDPAALPLELADAVGTQADHHIAQALEGAEIVVCGWGASGPAQLREARITRVLELVRAAGHEPRALSTTRAGHPGHPLYLRSDLPLPGVWDGSTRSR